MYDWEVYKFIDFIVESGLIPHASAWRYRPYLA